MPSVTTLYVHVENGEHKFFPDNPSAPANVHVYFPGARLASEQSYSSFWGASLTLVVLGPRSLGLVPCEDRDAAVGADPGLSTKGGGAVVATKGNPRLAYVVELPRG